MQIGSALTENAREVNEENVVVAKIATTTQHDAISGKTQMSETTFYNLDVIISVGYRQQ